MYLSRRRFSCLLLVFWISTACIVIRTTSAASSPFSELDTATLRSLGISESEIQEMLREQEEEDSEVQREEVPLTPSRPDRQSRKKSSQGGKETRKDEEWWRDPFAQFGEDGEIEELLLENEETSAPEKKAKNLFPFGKQQEYIPEEEASIPEEKAAPEKKAKNLFPFGKQQGEIPEEGASIPHEDEIEEFPREEEDLESSSPYDLLSPDAKERLEEHSIIMADEEEDDQLLDAPTTSTKEKTAVLKPAPSSAVIKKKRKRSISASIPTLLLPAIPSFRSALRSIPYSAPALKIFIGVSLVTYVLDHFFGDLGRGAKPKQPESEGGENIIAQYDENDQYDEEDQDESPTTTTPSYRQLFPRRFEKTKKTTPASTDTTEQDSSSSSPFTTIASTLTTRLHDGLSSLTSASSNRQKIEELEEELKTWKEKALAIKEEKEDLAKDYDYASKQLESIKTKMSKLTSVTRYLKSQLEESQKDVELAVQKERQKANEELQRIRDQMMHVLKRERLLMRESMMKNAARVRALMNEQEDERRVVEESSDNEEDERRVVEESSDNEEDERRMVEERSGVEEEGGEY